MFSALTRDDLLAYYRARYVPNNLVVVVAGAFDPAATRAAIVEHFGGAPRARLAPVPLPGEPRQLARRTRHLFEDVRLTRVEFGWQIPGLAHPDAPALDVLATILGGGDSSVLWQAIREKARLVHGIDAQAWNPGTAGLFLVSLTCDAGKREAACAAMERELARRAASGFPARLHRQGGAPGRGRRDQHAQDHVGSGVAPRRGRGGGGRSGLQPHLFRPAARAHSCGSAPRAPHPPGARRLTVVSMNPTGAKPAGPPPASAREGAGSAAFAATILPNGARLLLQPDHHLPNLHLRLLFLGGPAYEPAGARGATELLATLLTKDTRTRSAAAVARAIEEVGGSFYPFAGNNSFGLAVEVLPADLPRALDRAG